MNLKASCYVVILAVMALQIVAPVAATRRTFPSSTDLQPVLQPGQANSPESPPQPTSSKQKWDEEEANSHKGYRNIGSRPPSCEHKCYRCFPCEPIQVPTIARKHNSHFGIQYTNYEPEGWKCKCGPSFYSP